MEFTCKVNDIEVSVKCENIDVVKTLINKVVDVVDATQKASNRRRAEEPLESSRPVKRARRVLVVLEGDKMETEE